MSEFLFDLKHPESSWSGISYSYFPSTDIISSKVGSVTPPSGEHALFWMLDTVMYENPEGTDCAITQMPHYHEKGYETFFVDSGKVYIYINGQRALAQKGDIVHLQAGQTHGMYFMDDVKWRGTYHDLFMPEQGKAAMKVMEAMPELKDDPFFKSVNMKMDHFNCEPFLCKEVPTEQCLAIKNPSRPHASYQFNGVTVKIMVERWENGGVKELALFEMQPGFTAEWEQFPAEQELLYLRKGKIRFKVMNEEFVADDECVISIPKFAPHSLEVLEYSELYDMGGQVYWSILMQTLASLKHYHPEQLEDPEKIEQLKKQFACPIKTIGMR